MHHTDESRTQRHHFYGSLAPWWALISPVEDYEEEAAFIAKLLGAQTRSVRDVLELGSGGGHNAAHLRERFGMTLTDLSEDMLEVSRHLNPDSAHICADMRTLRLAERFDAVLIHDAIDYMTTEEDLSAAIQTAFVHCREGGVAIFIPDDTRETFSPGTDHGGSDAPDGRGARYLAWSWDPDPTDHQVSTEYVFILRQADGEVTTLHETHHTGLFSRETWLRLLHAQGFTAEVITEETEDDRTPRLIFIGHHP